MTRPVWTADVEIDAPLAAYLIRTQFAELACITVSPFGFGWDNAAFLIDGHVVFRFPRRRVAARLIERETAILPRIAPLLPLAIPVPSFVGVPAPEYPWNFAGYERLEGLTACSVPLTDEARGSLAAPLGSFLRALHAIDPGPLVPLGLPGDEIGRLDHAKRLRLARERLPALAEAGVISTTGNLLKWLEAHPPGALQNDVRVVHGDLYARHILLDAAGLPNGVIDWGDVHAGDPALDIAIAHLVLPRVAHAAFRAAYGPIDERTWEAACFRAVYHAILEIDYGLREKDGGMCEIGLAALRFTGVDG